jgi:hypothetical protein
MGYAGTAAPVNPGTLKDGATADETKAFNDLAAKYNTDQPKYQADQATYNQYKTDYQNRMQNTPMYAQAQFQTKQPSTIDDMYKYYLGREADTPGKTFWQGQYGNGPLTQAQKDTMALAAQPEIAARHPGSQDQYNRTGSYWGNQLAMPTYGQGSDTTGFTPIATAPVPVAAVAPTNNGTNGLVVSHGGNGNGTTVGDTNSVRTDGAPGYSGYTDPATQMDGLTGLVGLNDGWGTLGGSGGGSFGGSSVGGNNAHDGDSSHGTRGWAMGGLVQKYADGGEAQDFGGVGEDPSIPMEAAPSPGANVEGNLGLDVSRLTPAQAQFLAQQDPGAMARGVDRFNQAQPAQQAPQQETLPQMAAAYATPEMAQYTQEYQAARKQAALDRANFEKVLQASLNRTDATGPSKAEMYFNLAAAFGAPTKTGSFGESLANASTVMAGHKKGEREAALAARDRKDKLALDIAQYRATGSKDDLANLRTLTAEEMKALRLAGMPVSEAGKMVYDMGLRPGMPGYAETVSKIATQQMDYKMPAPHYLPGKGGTTLAITRSGTPQVVTDEQGQPVIDPNYVDANAPVEPVLGVPVPKVLPWQNQSNPKAANTVKASELARGAKEVEADAEAAKKSAATAQEAARFQLLNKNVETGGIADKFSLGQNIQSLGTDYADMLGITSRLAPGVRPVGSGSTSDKDMEMYKKGTVGVDKPREANDNIAQAIQLQSQRDQDYADFRSTYLEQNGTLQGANKHWKEYANAYPIFDPTSPKVPKLNANRMDWKSYFSGNQQAGGAQPVAGSSDLAGAAAAELAKRRGGK